MNETHPALLYFSQCIFFNISFIIVLGLVKALQFISFAVITGLYHAKQSYKHAYPKNAQEKRHAVVNKNSHT